MKGNTAKIQSFGTKRIKVYAIYDYIFDGRHGARALIIALRAALISTSAAGSYSA
jgi:hypothetical protein